MKIDYALCIELLGLNANQFKLTQSVPPHTITYWDGPDPQPTEAECKAVWETYIAAEPIRLLRIERNQKLAETDWWAGKDVTMSQARKDYRQALRDLPATANPTLDENDQLTNITWPTKPE